MGVVTVPPVYAQKGTMNTSASVTLETRIATDADSCPTAVEVWLTATTDTIQAMQLAIAWDRPDFGRFTTRSFRRFAIDTLDRGDSAMTSGSKADSLITVPVLNREDGLLSNWEYVEARGGNGLSVRVTAFPYLTAKGDASPLLPSDSGLLFSLPVEVLPEPPVALIGDSASVGMSPEAVLLSDPNGKLMKNITLRQSSIRATACWSARKKR